MPTGKHPLDWIDNELSSLDAQGLLRRPIMHRGPQGAHVEIAGRRCINFGANDYLGLAGDVRVAAAACAAIQPRRLG